MNNFTFRAAHEQLYIQNRSCTILHSVQDMNNFTFRADHEQFYIQGRSWTILHSGQIMNNFTFRAGYEQFAFRAGHEQYYIHSRTWTTLPGRARNKAGFTSTIQGMNNCTIYMYKTSVDMYKAGYEQFYTCTAEDTKNFSCPEQSIYNFLCKERTWTIGHDECRMWTNYMYRGGYEKSYLYRAELVKLNKSRKLNMNSFTWIELDMNTESSGDTVTTWGSLIDWLIVIFSIFGSFSKINQISIWFENLCYNWINLCPTKQCYVRCFITWYLSLTI